jgi:hypothetical protein
MAYRKAQGPVEAEMTLLRPAMYPWPTGDFESARDAALHCVWVELPSYRLRSRVAEALGPADRRGH